MLRIAIVGCGKIADAHADVIGRVDGCRIVAVCDQEALMARQLKERYPIEACFDDLEELIEMCKPDAVHITTPPRSHFPIAKQCLEKGCNVYVEKPFTVDSDEALRLFELANEKGLQITAGHDDQFSHAARRMRRLVKEGYLGGAPLHMESYYNYHLSGAYATSLMGDKDHWVRKLPGQLLQNIISHGIARIAEYLEEESPAVIAHGFTSDLLRGLGETELVDELRVMVVDRRRTTAYFTFSTQMHPELHKLRLYGSKNGLELDLDNQTVIRLRGERYTSYAENVLPPLNFAKQNIGNLIQNSWLFLKRDFHTKSGMKFLIESFYKSITDGAPPPIPQREILLVSRIMDEIFLQLGRGRTNSEQVDSADLQL